MSVAVSRDGARASSKFVAGRPAVRGDSRSRGRRGSLQASIGRLAAFATAAALSISLSASAAEKAVDRLDLSGPVIVVRFNVPVTYLSHSPAAEGQTLQIDLRPLRDAGGQAPELGLKERVSVKDSADVPLSEATYEELTTSSARLTLSFARSIKFRVKPGGDSRSIEITIGDAAPPKRPQDEVVLEAPPPNPTLGEPVPETDLPTGELAETMAAARGAMEKGDYDKAIRLLTKVLSTAGNEAARPEALELLGLARERNKQVAHAKAEYEEYLRLYPKGEGADRVRQRLAGLVTAASKPQARLRESSRNVASGDGSGEFFVRGSFSQSLRRDQNVFTDMPEDGVTRFDLDSDLDTTPGYSDDNVVLSLRGNGGYVHDLMNSGDNSEGRITSLFVEISDPERQLYSRIGRQTRSTDGVLGRFDGGLLSAKLYDEMRVNLVAGMPVDSSHDLFVQTDRWFGGVGFDIGPIFDDWNLNVYAIDQTVDNISDRRAVGGEVRYTTSDVNVFGLVDFDISYDKVNIAILSGNYFFEDRSTFNFAVDYRTSPILTTTSALQGQTVSTIQDLLGLFNEDQVRQLALDRTATIKSASIGASHPFNDNFQVSSDVMVTDTSGTVTSGGVDGMPAPGMEYYYGLQFTGTNLFLEGDIAALGFRYADQDQFNRATIDLNTRFPMTPLLRMNPRLRVDYRWNDADDGTELSIKPSVRMNYRALDDWELEMEFGGDWRNTETMGVQDDLAGYFIYLTYRLDY